jgi:DNA repair protein RadC
MTDIPFVRVTLGVDRTVKLNSMLDLIGQLGDMGLSGSAQEQLWVISLDSLNQIRNITVVSVGTYHDCFVSVPTILSPVLLSATDRFIMAHNHPNGRPNPTADDIDLTSRVKAAADIMDISFDDHVIVSTSGGWSSMKALGHL